MGVESDLRYLPILIMLYRATQACLGNQVVNYGKLISLAWEGFCFRVGETDSPLSGAVGKDDGSLVW